MAIPLWRRLFRFMTHTWRPKTTPMNHARLSKDLLLVTAATLLIAGCYQHPQLGPVSQRFYDAGGGDPTRQTGDQIMSWFLDGHRRFATYLAEECGPLLSSGIYVQAAEKRNDAKVCMAAQWTRLEELPRDRRVF